MSAEPTPEPRQTPPGIRTLRSAIWIIIALLALGYLILPVANWIAQGPLTVTLPGTQIAAADLADVGGVSTPTGELALPVEIAQPTVTDYAWQFGPSLLMLAGLGAIGVLLLRITADLAAGDPFRPGNTTRLRIVTGILLFVPLIVAVLQGIADQQVATNHLPDQTGSFAFSFPLVWLAGGVVVALIAEAFAIGTRQRRDLDGLV